MKDKFKSKDTFYIFLENDTPVEPLTAWQQEQAHVLIYCIVSLAPQPILFDQPSFC